MASSKRPKTPRTRPKAERKAQASGPKTQPTPLDVLFISELPLWPLDQGFRVHGHHMATALAEMGLRVGVASIHRCAAEAPGSLTDLLLEWPIACPRDVARFTAGWAGRAANPRRRLAQHQALDTKQLAGVIGLVDRYQPQVVIGLGQHSPMMLRGLGTSSGARRIWYAADEPVYFHLSCLRREPLGTVPQRLRKVALYAAIEALFVRGLDGAIGVSPIDSRLLRIIGGARRTITIRNGVDLDYFSPQPPNTNHPPQPKTLLFWGRMDFEPNVDAVCWFARAVWPALRHICPAATWRIVGKNPHPRVAALDRVPGVEVVGPVDDIRPYARSAAVTIVPMRCGGGIKNKLLEAAAMGLATVASPRAVRGLAIGRGDRPVMIAQTPPQWVVSIRRLWGDAPYARRLRHAARKWVETEHRWTSAAARLLAWLGDLPDRSGDAAGPDFSPPSHAIRTAKSPTSALENRNAA